MSFRLEFSSVKHGWSNLSVRGGDHAYEIEGFSYTTNAFSDLVRLAVDTALGALSAEVVLDGEPFGWAIEFKETWDEIGGRRCRLQIFDLEDASEVETRRQEVFAAPVERDEFAQAMLEAITLLNDTMGADAFEKAWMQPFPNRGVAALRAALSASPRVLPPSQSDQIIHSIALRDL